MMNTGYGLLAAALLLGGSSAMASTLQLTFAGSGPSVTLSTSDTDSYATGSLNFSSPGGQSFIAYCVELSQSHARSLDGVQTYQVSAFSAPQASLLQGLYSSSYAGLGNASQQAAFQLAVWEITHETTPTLNVNTGSFYFDGLQSGSLADGQAFTALANGYLSAASSYQGPSRYTITRLSNAQYQDLITAAPVPEPKTYVLMLAGVAMVGWIARRRRTH